ncbi:MAG: hypothetical protein BWZ02_00448 [Lentisphaerae bacterium ADurb.BinA184]|nr:MAG: hypothetical protein BWZ02_00448 [Lentisphaerae bacterium ADurb.BinA184]
MAAESMSLRHMSRPRALVIGALLGALLYVLIHMLLTARQSQAAAQLRGRVAGEQDKLRASEALIRESGTASRRCRQAGETLLGMMETRLVAGDNFVAWVSSVVADAAAASGVRVRSISGAGTLRVTPRAVPAKDGKAEKVEPILLEDSQANIELECNYAQVGRFLAILEQRYPYSRLDTLSMRIVSEENPETGLQVSLRYGFAGLTEDGLPRADRPSREELDALSESDPSTP